MSRLLALTASELVDVLTAVTSLVAAVGVIVVGRQLRTATDQRDAARQDLADEQGEP